jgi:hypothetical protein
MADRLHEGLAMNCGKLFVKCSDYFSFLLFICAMSVLGNIVLHAVCYSNDVLVPLFCENTTHLKNTFVRNTEIPETRTMVSIQVIIHIYMEMSQ